ncbi:MAG: FAD:protein FMN transferase, partial [Nocardioides sp.]|nr:FAD:protein FMN transferase [Nocardioides sp.]
MEATYRFEVWSSAASIVVTDPAALAAVVELVRAGLDDVDLACSRFRPDSELANLTPGSTQLSPLLADLVGTALDAAEASGGLVDPTVGAAMQGLGYDRSIELLPADGLPVRRVQHVPGWRRVHLYGDRLELPPGVMLDLGATAKSRAADLLARRAADTVRVGVLVELGGDIATAGPAPDGGWQVLVRDTEEDPACQVTLTAGSAVATSSTVRRTWRRGGVRLHHVLDPRTAAPAEDVWRSVSVAAPTCVEANTASTAAVVLGP